ncbi:MAG: helix-turn-helix transcriptional regulator [Lachnospiraceae bacterium]|nr:helix-turn-helix transcriptional regulator [Lachnospiraceae bacterium]
METIGQRLKAWRKEKGLSTPEISAKTGLSTGGLSAYERDEKLIGSKTLLALWREYDIDIAWILTGKRAADLSPEEQKLVDLYRCADERGKRSIMRSAEAEATELESSTSQIG